MKYVEPNYEKTSFTCPHCDVLTTQSNYHCFSKIKSIFTKIRSEFEKVEDLCITRCFNCSKIVIWFQGNMIYPGIMMGKLLDEDVPETIKDDYDEARRLSTISSRASAAMLRLTLDRLCDHLGSEGRDLFCKIGDLVTKGLPEIIQQAMDVLRANGNFSIHPGIIDLKDDSKTVAVLFDIFNIIVEEQVTKPKKITALHDKLPQNIKDSTKKRNSKNQTS